MKRGKIHIEGNTFSLKIYSIACICIHVFRVIINYFHEIMDTTELIQNRNYLHNFKYRIEFLSIKF